MKKLKSVLLLPIMAVGFIAMAEGDTPAPQRPDLAYGEGHISGISKLEAHGDHGGAPAYDHGRPPAPAYEYVK
ncbi:hypothetical protein P9W99_01360 [Bacillus cereus]|uniref:Response regulator aspartate phosphatase inhibitor n=1 Tax=Bacillus cereus ISP2954 TaxID=1053215 RepID=A0A9W5VC31_BACCE|nr:MULTISPECIES: hypothetical protein [Bacillus cereus group]AGE81056.1 hypothetical protein HD73_5479 [Bacillus thuringiensis serovar kurstaki str. HD73]AIE36435.1 hypothetical protein BTK_27140 [Bacillus thuringiensis serovar kurstaki str. HD-1]AJA22363.1 hypothetical protein BT4G5_27085 [Bacillus thuringiensis serovar galleriae]AJK42466.1 hypothetical protein BG08_625 [Bacillus thuringiensis serovar kurstaki]AKJ59783.1 hypothetical protein XI92_16665 [Bacillus thuringiensis]